MQKTMFLAMIAACLAVNAYAQQNGFYLHNSDRVVFYGDSITDQRNYTMMIETMDTTGRVELDPACAGGRCNV